MPFLTKAAAQKAALHTARDQAAQYRLERDEARAQRDTLLHALTPLLNASERLPLLPEVHASGVAVATVDARKAWDGVVREMARPDAPQA